MSAIGVLDTLAFALVVLSAFALGVILAWLAGSREYRERGWWCGYEQRARAAGQRHAILHEDTKALPTVDLRGQPPVSSYTPRHAAWSRPRLAITAS